MKQNILAIIGASAFLFGCDRGTGPGENLPPLPLPITDRIVFESDRADSLGDIFATTLDGSNTRRLTSSKKGEICPSISPDGNWIAYYVRSFGDSHYFQPYTIALMRANGTDSRRIAQVNSAPGCPLWSRQSDSFAVTYYLDPPTSLPFHVMTDVFDLGGSLRSTLERYSAAPVSFSPNGQGFMGTQETCGPNGCTVPDIYISPLNGYPTRYLTGGGPGGSFQSEGGAEPELSPDGANVAFICAATPGGSLNGVCTIAWDGSGKTRLTGNAFTGTHFSPDGTKISFVTLQPRGVATMAKDGSNIVVWPFGGNAITGWTGDGTHLIAPCNSSTDLCVVDTATGDSLNVTAGQGINQHASIARTWYK